MIYVEEKIITQREKSFFFFFQEKHPHSPLCRLLLVRGIFRLTATVSESVIEGDELLSFVMMFNKDQTTGNIQAF